jgi:type VI secretion system ImpC/EvpB family protein
MQKKLLRVRPPRVRITYDVETGGATEKTELPFVVGILADLSGDRDTSDPMPMLKDRKLSDIDGDSFNDFMKRVAPRVAVDAIRSTSPLLQELLTQAGDQAIVFSSLEDFNPMNIIRALPSLNALYKSRMQIVTGNQDESATTQVKQTQGNGAIDVLDMQVARIDRQLSAALSAILHTDTFKQVEATWRGLHYLVTHTETSDMLKLRVLNVSKEELRDDLLKATEFDQSALFKMVYEDEYGTYGGFPYSLLAGAYEIGGNQADIDFLKKISEVAASAHAPFIASASSELFGLAGFEQLDKPRDLRRIFESIELNSWCEFRDTEDARYVSLVLPRTLMRLPYGKPEKRNTIECEGFPFEEIVGEQDAEPVYSEHGDVLGYPMPNTGNFVWGNATFLLAERITNAFSLYRWASAITGVEGGGLVENLPHYTYTSSTGATELLGPTEVSITDGRERELHDLGFISLCRCEGSGTAVFFSSQTTNLPKKYFSDEASANARMSAMLPYMLATSRFAHYIKVIMRKKIGSFLTRANVESYLNTWIANYVLLDDNASQEVKASYPLRSASVVVTDVPGEPDAYKATVFIKPHFQLEELTTSIRLVVDLPK